MIAFYFKKTFWDGRPHDKKRQEIDTDLKPPTYRPGWWVKFVDPSLEQAGEVVGKIYYVTFIDGKPYYEILHGFSCFGVEEPSIIGRMVLEDD